MNFEKKKRKNLELKKKNESFWTEIENLGYQSF